MNGVGAVYAGQVLLRTTRYELSVWSDDQPAASGDDPKTVTSVDGRMDITGIGEAVVLAGPGTLSLTIEDGRRLAFQLKDSLGGIVGRGWLA